MTFHLLYRLAFFARALNFPVIILNGRQGDPVSRDRERQTDYNTTCHEVNQYRWRVLDPSGRRLEGQHPPRVRHMGNADFGHHPNHQWIYCLCGFQTGALNFEVVSILASQEGLGDLAATAVVLTDEKNFPERHARCSGSNPHEKDTARRL
jgi:hypothetical protein